MTEPRTRRTPALMAQSHGPVRTRTTAAAGYDRHRWEEALLATELPHHAARVFGWGLAHLAGDTGRLAGGATHADRLAEALRLTGRQVRLSLQQLETAGLISRPDIHTWQPRHLMRPITLTLPAEATPRQEPAHTGEAP